MDSPHTLVATANQYLNQIAILPELTLTALDAMPDEQRSLVEELARIVIMPDDVDKARTLCELVKQLPRLCALLSGESGEGIDVELYIPLGTLDPKPQLRPPVLDNTSLDQVWRKLCLAYYGIDPGLSRSSDSNDQSLPGNVKGG